MWRLSFQGSVFLATAILAVGPAAAQIDMAKLTGGTVSGVVADGIATFKGIPFAAPPLADLRWKPPAAVKPWPGVLKADHFGAACMQAADFAKTMGYDGPISEDCLYLNVWTPARSRSEKLPVIVWIHLGGYFSSMTALRLYDGSHFARRGVIFVSVAYRLGPFGFLATPELSRESGHASGNYGLLDMIAGLKWVHENIAQFGGDPAKVTVMAASAASNAATRLAASPLAKGLFRGVIAQSGTNFSPRPTSLAEAEAFGTQFLAGLGVADLKAARALTAGALEAATDAPGARRFPTADDGYVVPGNQVDLWQSGRFNDTPILTGSTSDESFSGAKPSTPERFEKAVRSTYGSHADAILMAYPHSTEADATRAAKFLRRDAGTAWGHWTWANLQSSHGKGKVFVYYFDKPTAVTPDGSAHGADVPLVFGNEDHWLTKIPWTDRERALSKQLQSYWANFAKTGDPNGPGLPEWPPYAGTNPQVMRLGAKAEPGPVPNLEGLRALDGYFHESRSQTSAAANAR
jgi:para-nitrobenzyl esterase